MKQNIIQSAKLIIIALVIGAVAQIVIAADPWRGAPGTPPGCPSGTTGCDAPINVGNLLQVKEGAFTSRKYVSAPDGVFTALTATNNITLAQSSTRVSKWSLLLNSGGVSGASNTSFALYNVDPRENYDLVVDGTSGYTYVNDVCLKDKSKCLSDSASTQTSYAPSSKIITCEYSSKCTDGITPSFVGKDTSGQNYYDCPDGYFVRGVFRDTGGTNRVLGVTCQAF